MPTGHAILGIVEYGPYHRRESPTQTVADAARQQASGELWGQTARGGSGPSVKAYRGALPTGTRGIEFMTVVAPYPNPHPHLVQWRESTPGVRFRFTGTGTFVAIPVRVTVNTQV
jgi:hypothetical protein